MQESKSSRIFLISSVILGVLAAVISFAYLDQSKAEDRTPKVNVLVARHDLRENAALDVERDLEEMPIPVRMTELRMRALRPEDKASYKGQRVNRRILAGTPVMLADLVAAANLELKGDSRAMSVAVRGAQALSGLLVPGDYVKVMVTRSVMARSALPAARPRPAAGKSADAGGEGADADSPSAPLPPAQWETVSVLPNPIKVLAVGSRLARSRQQIAVADQFQAVSEPESQQTVTLEVTESDAKTILQQTGAGALPVTLILCPPPGN